MSERRVMVTGGAGFIGSHVCAAYREEGWSVTAVDDLSTGRRENVPSGVELVEMDIRSDDLADLFAARDFEVVNHHAAQVDVRVSVRDPMRDASINVIGLLNVLERSRESGVRRFVYVSSGGVVYGEPPEEALPLPEDAPKRPLSPYGVGKLTGEDYLYFYRRVHGLEGVTLRYSNVYGPRQDPHGEAGVVAIFAGRVLQGEPLKIFGDGRQTRDYVYVEDVARANLLLTEAELSEPDSIDDVAFNVGTGTETSVLELAEAIMEAGGRTVELERRPARAGELERSALDVAKLRSLGWAPSRGLEDGLRTTLEHVAGEAG